MTDKRLSELLQIWRTWLRRSNLNLGFRPRSLGMSGTGATDFEALFSSAEDSLARSVDAAVDDLPPRERDAVSNAVLATSRPLGEPLEVVYERARESLMQILRRRGVE
jgi:hypothetical protein